MKKEIDLPPFLIIPSLTLHSDELYTYGRIEWIRDIRKSHKNSLNNLKNNQTKGNLSHKSKLKVERAFKLMLCHASKKVAYNYKTKSKFKFKLNFITLTLPSEQSETDIEFKHEYLNHFLTIAKKKWSLKNYIWKAEKQANGNIHIHIVSDVFIPWLELRNTWNRILSKHNYIDNFSRKWKHECPNSTDIHAISDYNESMEYMNKYLKKDSKGSTIKGNIWRCSTTLSNNQGAKAEISMELNNELERLRHKKDVKIINGDYFSGMYFDNSIIKQKDFPYLYKLWSDYVIKIFEYQQQRIDNYGT